MQKIFATVLLQLKIPRGPDWNIPELVGELTRDDNKFPQTRLHIGNFLKFRRENLQGGVTPHCPKNSLDLRIKPSLLKLVSGPDIQYVIPYCCIVHTLQLRQTRFLCRNIQIFFSQCGLIVKIQLFTLYRLFKKQIVYKKFQSVHVSPDQTF